MGGARRACGWARAARATRRSTRSPIPRSACCSSRCCSPTRAASLLALGLGCALWFAVVPLRLRGVGGAGHGAPRRRPRRRCGPSARTRSAGPRRRSPSAPPPATSSASCSSHGPRAAGRRPGGRLRHRRSARRAPTPAARRASPSLVVLGARARRRSPARWRCPARPGRPHLQRAGTTSPTRTPARRPTTPTASPRSAASARATGTRR